MTVKYFCPYCKAELKVRSRNSCFYECKCDDKYDYFIHWFKCGNNWEIWIPATGDKDGDWKIVNDNEPKPILMGKAFIFR
jgi:hypothetical protein